MNLLIDTNVILDVLLKREPYYKDAIKITILSEKGFISGYISASSVTDIFYIVKKELKSKDLAFDLLKNILKIMHVASVTENNIYEALDLQWDDFEDSVQYVAGQNISAKYIVTRNPKDFSDSHIKVLSPEEFINQVASQNDEGENV